MPRSAARRFQPAVADARGPEPLGTLPFIVVVIDELADLMMVVGKKVEQLIARLAQKARGRHPPHSGDATALGRRDHRPDQGQYPDPISFQVSSKIDSRTILDQMGAEALLGQGDMLYLAPGTGYPTRVHGAFVADDEVHHVVDYLKMAGVPEYVDGVLTGSGGDDDEGGEGADGGDGDPESDALYDQAVEVVMKNRRASISLVQRHLRIGYNRAARLIEAMEKPGWCRRWMAAAAAKRWRARLTNEAEGSLSRCAARSSCLACLTCLLLIGPSLARADSLDRLRAFLESTKTLRAEFSQTVIAKNGRKPQFSSGGMAIARPHKFRWQIESRIRN